MNDEGDRESKENILLACFDDDMFLPQLSSCLYYMKCVTLPMRTYLGLIFELVICDTLHQMGCCQGETHHQEIHQLVKMVARCFSDPVHSLSHEIYWPNTFILLLRSVSWGNLSSLFWIIKRFKHEISLNTVHPWKIAGLTEFKWILKWG